MPTLYDVSLFFYIMNTNIRKILNDKYGLFEKDINILLEKFTRLSLKKKETILQEGQADHYIYFVEKGIVKSTIFREGREFIVFFALENEVPFSSPDLIHSGQSLYTLETIDDCILWRISRKDLADLFGTSINLSNWGRMLLQEWLALSSSYFSTCTKIVYERSFRMAGYNSTVFEQNQSRYLLITLW